MLNSKISAPSGPAKNMLIMLHGYGADADNVFPIAVEMGSPNTVVVCPNAPNTLDYGGYYWFSVGDLSNLCPKFLAQGVGQVRTFLMKQIQELLSTYNLTYKDLVLTGFSQGGMLALDLLVHIEHLSKAISFSGGYLGASIDSLKNKHKQALLIHGDEDSVVPYEMLDHSCQILSNMGIKTFTHTCEHLGHAIDASGLKEAKKFIQGDQ